METTRLDFPILIEQDSSGYQLQPLLFKGPESTASRYGNAVSSLQKTIRKHFRNSDIDREIIEEMLWFQFSPEVQFYREFISIRSGMHLLEGHIAIASYYVDEHKFLCLPKFGHLTLRIPKEIRGKAALSQYLADQLIAFFKNERKRLGSEFNRSDYFSENNIQISHINFQIEYQRNGFRFEEEEKLFLSLFGEQAKFIGHREIDKVAEVVDIDDVENCSFRDKEAKLLQRSLFGPKASAVAIIGYSGVGKSNVVNFAYKEFLADKNKRSAKLPKVWRLDPLRVISGMSIVGQWERRFETILTYIRDRITNLSRKNKMTDVLVIDNPIALMRIGKSSQTSLTLAHLLIPYIEKIAFPVVIEATPEQWQKMQDMNRRFTDLFQVQRLQPLEKSAMNDVILQRRADIEYRYQCIFPTKSLSALLRAEKRLQSSKVLPGSIIDLMQTIAINHPKKTIDESIIYQSLQDTYHINPEIMDQRITLSRDKIYQHFSSQLIGQEEACQTLVNTVLTIKANVQPSGKPLNTLLFIGPTGVGKTEASKLLVNYLFASDECLIRIDMNEYVDEMAIDRLIGGGLYRKGVLTERVRHQKTGVVLLDEIEKAHPSIHDLLLQLLDDGRLTDASGQTTDFTQTVIILTSNTGASEAASQYGFVSQNSDNKATYIKSVEKHFRPELVNRINQIIVFENLQLKHMQKLAMLHLHKLLQRDGFTRRNTILNVAPDCLEYMAKLGYDPSMGARALKRNLERLITHSTAAKLTQTRPDSPIILNMTLEDNQLVSKATELQFSVPYQHSIPTSVTYTLEQYQELLSALESAEEKLSGQPSDDIKWGLIDALRDIKEPLERFIFELEEKPINSLSFTFKSFVPRYLESFRSPRIEFSALHAEQDISLFLEDQYQRSSRYFSLEKSNQYELWSQHQRLLHAVNCYCERGIDQLYLQITPLLATENSNRLDLLSDLYQHLIGQHGHVDTIEYTNNKRIFRCHGPGIKEWLHTENGIHLFHKSGEHSLPVLVTFSEQVIDANIEDYKIIRVYTHSGKGDNVTDVRSGLMTDSQIGEQWWALVFANQGENYVV